MTVQDLIDHLSRFRSDSQVNIWFLTEAGNECSLPVDNISRDARGEVGINFHEGEGSYAK